MREGFAQAATALNTMLVVPIGDLDKLGKDVPVGNIVPVVRNAAELGQVPAGTRMLEIEWDDNWSETLKAARAKMPDAIVGVRIGTGPGLEQRLLDTSRTADAVHVLLDRNGRDVEGRYARDALREMHRTLVKAGHRDEVTIITGGGIAAAEHVPKTIICGADVVAMEEALLVSLGCRACADCKAEGCPADVMSSPSGYVKGRTVNMCNAWRDQILEVLGAMGIKEVRRLRGEVGRAIFQEDAERDSFASMIGGDASG